MKQEHAQSHRRQGASDDADASVAEVPTRSSGAPDLSAVDALLDEIDDLLEDNAEAFVQAFVQKGGE